MISLHNYTVFIKMLKLQEISMILRKCAMNYCEVLELLASLKKLYQAMQNKKNNNKKNNIKNNNKNNSHTKINKMKKIKACKIKVKINFKKYVKICWIKCLSNLIMK